MFFAYLITFVIVGSRVASIDFLFLECLGGLFSLIPNFLVSFFTISKNSSPKTGTF